MIQARALEQDRVAYASVTQVVTRYMAGPLDQEGMSFEITVHLSIGSKGEGRVSISSMLCRFLRESNA